jgi:DNA-binding NarL/FixJ family response regulator
MKHIKEDREPIRILVVEDHFVTRLGLISVIQTQPDMVVVAEAQSGEDAIALYLEHRPNVILMDLRIQGMSGIDSIIAIRKEDPKAKTIVLTTYEGNEHIYRAIQAGVHAYLLKNVDGEELLKAIRLVHSGHRYIPTDIAMSLAERLPKSDLTFREMEVLKELVKGLNNREIASSLAIAEATVREHVSNILSKLNVRDRTQAVSIALKQGIIQPE